MLPLSATGDRATPKEPSPVSLMAPPPSSHDGASHAAVVRAYVERKERGKAGKRKKIYYPLSGRPGAMARERGSAAASLPNILKCERGLPYKHIKGKKDLLEVFFLFLWRTQ